MTTNPQAVVDWLVDSREALESQILINRDRRGLLSEEPDPGKFDADSANLIVEWILEAARSDAMETIDPDPVAEIRAAVDRYCEVEGHVAEGWVLAIERRRKEPIIETSADIGTAQAIGILALADANIRQYGL